MYLFKSRASPRGPHIFLIFINLIRHDDLSRRGIYASIALSRREKSNPATLISAASRDPVAFRRENARFVMYLGKRSRPENCRDKEDCLSSC